MIMECEKGLKEFLSAIVIFDPVTYLFECAVRGRWKYGPNGRHS